MVIVAVTFAVVITVMVAIAVVIAFMIAGAETSSLFFPAPIVPFRSLPTQESPRIVLNGNQGLYRADARIGNVTPAPVLNYAVWMFLRLLSAPVSVLPKGRQTRESKNAKHTHRHKHCGKQISHVASPTDSVRRLASGHLTAGNIIKRLIVLLGKLLPASFTQTIRGRLTAWDKNNLVHSGRFRMYNVLIWAVKTINRWDRSYLGTATQDRMLFRT